MVSWIKYFVSKLDMNYIYVGSSKSEEVNKYLADLGSVINYAGNTHQNALLAGFSAICNKFKVLSSWSISTYPRVKKIFFKRQVESIGNGKDNYIFIGVINLPVLNMLYRCYKMRKEIKKALDKNDDNAIIVYEVHTPFLLAATTLRKRIKHINVIVPDLPEHMIAHQNVIRAIAKKIDQKLINWCLSKCDSYTILSEQMTERLPMKDKKTIVVEGLFQNKNDFEEIEKDQHKVIMYTGILHKDKGIENLVKAFEQIKDPNYRLWIRGYGDYADEIVEKSKKDSRIVYLPPMSHHELFKLEQQATVMVNPTQPHLDFTRYFFPSKTMEYLASGTPTVMYRLSCMPKDYDKYIYYTNGDSTDDLTNKLIEVCEKSQTELYEFGKTAQKFILNEKNPIVQCQKIINIIK